MAEHSNMDLVLVCQFCRWRPPLDLQMALTAAHFDMEEGHDPQDIRLEMVMWCFRCDCEAPLTLTELVSGGRRYRHHHTCPQCHRTKRIYQEVKAAGA